MRARRVSAFGASAAMHVVALIAAVYLAKRSPVAAPPPVAAAEREPMVVLVESLPPSGPSSELDAPPDDLGLRVDRESSTVTLPGFTFDFSKVANRASVLF